MPIAPALGVAPSDLACAWGDALIAGREPESWGVVRRLRADGCAGILVPTFANGATAEDQNLVLWRWGPDLPHKVMVYDPTGKLPKNRSLVDVAGAQRRAAAAKRPRSASLTRPSSTRRKPSTASAPAAR